MDEMRALVAFAKPCFVCVTETWFTGDIDDSLIQIPGFLSFRNDRQDNPNDRRRGGGTVIYASSASNPQAITTIRALDRPQGIEYSILRATVPDTFYIICAYVPPGLTVDIFSQFRYHISDVIDQLLQSTPDANVFVCGDFNRYDFSFLTTEFNLCNIVHVPTFRDAILDKFYCDEERTGKLIAEAAPPLGSAIYLHNVIIISNCSRNVNCDNAFSQKVYDFRKSNLDEFLKRMSQIDWSAVRVENVNDSIGRFYDHFYWAMSCIPKSIVKFTFKSKPWITPIVIELINKRWRAFRAKDFRLYMHYKEKVKREIVKAKAIWSKRMRSSPKGLWSVVNSIRGKSESNSVTQLISLFDDNVHAVEFINSFFFSFFHCSESCSDSSLPPVTPTCRRSCDPMCDSASVHDLICKLRTDKATGSDYIPPILLKISVDFISEPLSYIFNLSYRSGSMPDIWKVADIVPIPKTVPVQKDKLRPISLLPVMSKICERIFLKYFYNSLIKCYDECQFAYRRDSSTVCALVTIHDTILRFLDDVDIGAVRVITFDMSHAFDSVSHSILLQRFCMSNFPDSDKFVLWLRSYLTNRKQRVRLGETTSSLCDVSSGVPQGSILGPFLFAIFMSTYNPFSPSTKVVKFADDVTIILPVHKSAFDDLSSVTCEVENFSLWCKENCMIINTGKTKALNINVTQNPLPPIPSMNEVCSLKILGLIFNNKLTWTHHFDFMISKLSRRLYVLRVLKRLLPHDQLVEVYNAILRSVFEYASQVFLNPGIGLDVRLKRVCKRAYRIVHGNDDVCTSCNMLDVTSRRNLLAMRLFLKAKNNDHHVLFNLIPCSSKRSNRIILPTVRTSRRVEGFIFSCSVRHNDNV